jgi:hypothetical protein
MLISAQRTPEAVEVRSGVAPTRRKRQSANRAPRRPPTDQSARDAPSQFRVLERRSAPSASKEQQALNFTCAESLRVGSGRPKGVLRCRIDRRRRGAAKYSCHAGFDGCSGDPRLSGTLRKARTKSGSLNLGQRWPRTPTGRLWDRCLSSITGIAKSATSRQSGVPSRPGSSPRTARRTSPFAWTQRRRPMRRHCCVCLDRAARPRSCGCSPCFRRSSRSCEARPRRGTV